PIVVANLLFHISRKSCAQLLREPSVREAKFHAKVSRNFCVSRRPAKLNTVFARKNWGKELIIEKREFVRYISFQ
ncbi:MAG: hypothetical protein DRR16_26225, partial [Candidatus Parabeggiatoa sp. nov. 3]